MRILLKKNMSILRKTSVSLLCILLWLLSAGCSRNHSMEETQEDEIYVNEIVKIFSEKMKNEYGLSCIGNGASMPYDIEGISIHFATYQRSSVEVARDLLIKVNQELLETINKHEKIRPYLREYPFSISRAEISISFIRKVTNEPYSDGSVAYSFHVRDKIFYRAMDSSTEKYFPLAEELYEEALKKVQSGQSKKSG